jgi:hypothetical protein
MEDVNGYDSNAHLGDRPPQPGVLAGASATVTGRGLVALHCFWLHNPNTAAAVRRQLLFPVDDNYFHQIQHHLL